MQGPQNRELKIWVFDNQSPQSGQGRWRCIQTLEFQSNGRPEFAFYNNQVAVAPRANLILLANFKRNAIYTVHFDSASASGGPRFDYLTEFAVQMPVISLTEADDGVSENGDGILKIFCLQTHVIQQFTVDMSQCLPDGIPADGSTPNTPKKGLGIPAPPPSPSYPPSPSFPPLDKAHPRSMANPTTGIASNVSSSPGIPPRPAATGNLIDMGPTNQMQVSTSEINKAFDSSKLTLLRDSKEAGTGRPGSPGGHEQVANRVVTRPDSGREGLTSSNLSKPPTPPPRRRLRSRSPAKEIQYAPVSASPSRYKVEKMEEPKEVLLDAEASAESTQPSFTTNTLDDESGDTEDKDGVTSNRTGNPVTTQPQLISPSDIMFMAAGSKRDDTLNQEGGLDLVTVSEWQDEEKVSASKDGMTSEDQVPDRDDASEASVSPLLDTAGSQGGTGTEFVEKQMAPESNSGPAAAEWQGGEEAQDGDLTEAKVRSSPDDLQDQLKNMALKPDRQAGAGVLSPTSSAVKGRKSKNKNGGAASVPLPTSLHLRSGSATNSGEVGSNSTPSPTNLSAQVASMQESIYQVLSSLLVSFFDYTISYHYILLKSYGYVFV